MYGENDYKPERMPMWPGDFEPKELKVDSVLDYSPGHPAIRITTTVPWYVRLWNLVSNPFLYVFVGKMRW